MKVSRNKLRSIIESILSEDSNENVGAAGGEIQQMIKSILASRDVNFDVAMYGDGIEVMSGDYLGSVNKADVEKLGSGGLESIINTVNKKFNSDVEMIVLGDRRSSEGWINPGGDVFLGKNGIEIFFGGGH